MNGLSSTEFAKQTNLAQARPPSLLVRSAASLMIIPTWRTASMLMPARVVATLTEEHKRFVADKRFRNRVEKLSLRVGGAFVNQRGIAANEIDADRARRFVDRARQLDRIAGGAFGDHGDGRDGNSLVGDPDAKLVANLRRPFQPERSAKR